jgi:hypothetical protein
MRLIPSVAALLAVAAAAFAQPRALPPPLAPGTSAIGGTLRDAITSAPVAGCTVRAGSGGRFSVVTTGQDGTYQFAEITEGDYFFFVECPSHRTACVPSSEPGLAPCSRITLFRDQRRSGVDFRLMPGAVARGRVIDGGRPVPNAFVRLGGPFPGTELVTTQPVRTKADGTFELARLPEGEWRLEVDVPPSPGAPRPPVIYYPGVISRDEAGAVTLAAGRVTENITITVPPILSRTVTVRVPPPDATMSSMIVAITRVSPLMTLRLDLDAEGQAMVRGLNEGRYFVTATALAGGEKWVAYQVIDFVQDSLEVSLHLQPAGRIRGRIVAAPGAMPPLNGASVGATWIDDDEVKLNPLSPDEAGVAADGTFEIGGLFGRRVLQLLRFDPDWKIESVRYGRSDVTTSGIDVTPNATTDVTIVVARR